MRSMFAVVVLVAFVVTTGCLHRRGTITTYTKTNDPNVKNGFVLEAGTIDTPTPDEILVLPVGTKVAIQPELDHVEFIAKKEQAVFSNPAKLISIDDTRHNLGIAFKRDPGRVTIATFGEFLGHGNGGTSIKLRAIIPSFVRVEFEDRLSGQESLANQVPVTGGPKPPWTQILTTPQKHPLKMED